MRKLIIPLYYMILLLNCIIIRNYTDKEYTLLGTGFIQKACFTIDNYLSIFLNITIALDIKICELSIIGPIYQIIIITILIDFYKFRHKWYSEIKIRIQLTHNI